MKSHLKRLALGLSLATTALCAYAGANGEIEPAPVYDEVINQISMREAEMLHEEGVQFYDVNEVELWAKGFIPGAIFFNVNDWKKLLPEDKSTTIVFYCVDPLCTSSEMAAREVMKLGYTDVRQMPEGITGWRRSNRPIELP